MKKEVVEICKGLSFNRKKGYFLMNEDFHPDNPKNPEAYFLLTDNFEQENLGDVEEESFFSGPSLEELNQYCYFCDFDKVMNIHHIVHKKQGGLNHSNNLIPLCPNHHSMIHKRIYILQFTRGFFYLVNPETMNIEVSPTKRQRVLVRDFPKSSLKNAIEQDKLHIIEKK